MSKVSLVVVIIAVIAFTVWAFAAACYGHCNTRCQERCLDREYCPYANGGSDE